MNSDIYIFGKFGSYYSQFPNDFTSEVFKKMSEYDTSSDTYISVHRKSELMYYGYVRKLEENCYIGICFVLNGMLVEDFNALFEIFDNIINHLAVNGDILKYSDVGNIVHNTQTLAYYRPVLNQVKVLLKDGLSELSNNFRKLPPEAYEISINESKKFDLCTDDMSQIVWASWNYSYTFITQKQGTPAPDTYQGILRRLHKEILDLNVTNSDLNNKIRKLEKKKKQQGVVSTLGAIIFVCFFILFGIKQSLDETQGNLNLSKRILENTQTELENTQSNFVMVKKRNEEMESQLSEKDNEIFFLQKEKERMVSEFEELRNENYKLLYSLQNVKKKLQNIESDNSDLKKKKTIQNRKRQEVSDSDNTRIIKAVVSIGSPIRTQGNYLAPIKMEVPTGAVVEVFLGEKVNGYYKVRYGQTIGYLAEHFIDFKK